MNSRGSRFDPSWPSTFDTDITVYPRGIRHVINYMANHYDVTLPMIVTSGLPTSYERGTPMPPMPEEDGYKMSYVNEVMKG